MGKPSGSVDIPIKHEPRTFEQHRRNMLSNLERRSQPGGQGEHRIVPFRDDWLDEVNRWTDSVWGSLDDDIRRMRSGMFALLPVDQFGYTMGSYVDPFSLMDHMERHVHDVRDRMGFGDVPVTGALTDFMKDAYELGEDGKVHFKVRFDASGFSPEDIKINTTENRLTVQAKKATQTDTSKSVREFCRVIELPQSIDHNHLQCHLTKDGVLMLEAPVKSPDYQSITFNEGRQLGIRPKTDSRLQSIPPLEIKGVTGPTVIDDGAGGNRLHVEVPVDGIYKPEDLCVNVDANRVVVTGRRCDTSFGKSRRNTSLAEFKQSYQIPETVDPLSMRVQLINNTLVLEAPLVKQHQVKMQELMQE